MIKFNEIGVRRRERRIRNRNKVAIFVLSFPSAKTNNNNSIKRDGVVFFIFAAKLAANVTNKGKRVVAMRFDLTHAIAKHLGNMRDTLVWRIGLHNHSSGGRGVFSSLRLVLRTTLSISNHS